MIEEKRMEIIGGDRMGYMKARKFFVAKDVSYPSVTLNSNFSSSQLKSLCVLPSTLFMK